MFLRSLREEACTLQENQNAQAWTELEQGCIRDLGLDDESLRFLVDGINYKRIRKGILNSAKVFAQVPRSLSLRPRVAVVLCEGQAIRTFVLTDVCKRLAAWAELFILTPHDLDSQLRTLGPHTHRLPVPIFRRNRFDYLVGLAGMRHTRSSTNMRMVERLDENLDEAITNGEPPQGVLRLWQIGRAYTSYDDYKRLYCWSLRFFARTYSLTEISGLLSKLDIDFMLNTSTVSWSSRPWTRAAALNNTPIVANVISWDNMSTKTLLDEFADTFLIWSEEMDEDFGTSLPFLRGKPRAIVGSPQFEPILECRGLISRTEFCERYNLDPAKKLILYTTGSKVLFPREAECLDTLIGHWQENLQDRANLMVRMHPKDREGRYETVRAKYPDVPFTLAGHNLTEDEDWVPTSDDIALLVNQLHYCDVVVNVASTMTLEGFVIDKPSINIGFTLGLSVNVRYPMDDYYQSRHYRDIVDTGAARLVNDYAELFAAIDDIIDGAAYDIDKQRHVLSMKCKHYADSSKRIDRFLSHYAFDRFLWSHAIRRCLLAMHSRASELWARVRWRISKLRGAKRRQAA